MSTEYLGKVDGLITVEDLSNLTKIQNGTIVKSGDITWLKFNDNGKILLVADRVLKHTISWDTDINNFSGIAGLNIAIGNSEFRCRVMTGANSEPGSSGGGEWDRLLVNLVPDNADSNWQGIYTWCRESHTSGSALKIVRGNTTVDGFSNLGLNTKNSTVGWRPILEVVSTNPYFSIVDENKGDILNFTPISYKVFHLYLKFNVVEKIDGTIIRTLENQDNGTSYTLDLSSHWENLSYGKHTVEITSTDSDGLSSTITIIFNKIKVPIQHIDTQANYNQLLEHNKEIKKELEYQNFRLGSFLKEKDVEVVPGSKMSSLIDKINEIRYFEGTKNLPKWYDFKFSDIWISAAGMPTSRKYLTSSVVDENIYAIGGDYPKNECYDPATNTWTTKANMLTGRVYLTSSVVDGKIYCIGGYTGVNPYLNKNECYDPGMDAWTTKANMLTSRNRLTSSTVNGKIYCIGGYVGNYINKNECYDPVTDTWTTKASLPSNRGHLASSVVNGKIYCIGGYNGNSVENRNECYDPVTDTWTTKATMPTSRESVKSSVINGKIYCIGGYGSSSLDKNECYDPATNTWTTKANLLTGRTGLTVSTIKETIYAIGGDISKNECYII